jgi:hypothetical protein
MNMTVCYTRIEAADPARQVTVLRTFELSIPAIIR